MAFCQIVRSLPLASKFLLAATWIGLAVLTGCKDKSNTLDQSSQTIAKTSSGEDAQQLIQKMRNRYRTANSYSDNATFVQQSVLRSEGVERKTSFHQLSLVFERPNKLRFKFQKTRSNSPGSDSYDVASNGVIVRSHATELPEQVHEAIAPLELTPDNIVPEPEIRQAIFEVSQENVYPQFMLLLGDGELFPNNSEPQLLEEQKLGETNCYRVKFKSDAGTRVLWIDSQTYALRRMELPLEAQLKDLDPQGLYSELKIWIDYDNPQFDSQYPAETYALEVPEGARRVRRLVAPPPPGPSPTLGQKVNELMFESLSGEEITSASLANKVVVFDFWYTGCPPCKMQTPTIDKVYQTFKENEQVAFYAVSTDQDNVSNDVVADTMKSWGGSMPVIRDTADSGYEKLNVRVTPTTVLLSRDGRLQLFQPGAHLDPAPLTEAIQELVDGEDLAANAIAAHQQRVNNFNQELEAATIKDSILEVTVSRPEVPDQQLPTKFKLEQVWQSTAEILTHPGDLLTIPAVGDVAGTILVLDAGKEIVELQQDGTLVDRHPLPDHSEQANGFLRSTLDDKGNRYYLASGVGWQKLYVMDHQWKSALTFPAEPHSGIGDVLFTDLTNSGNPMMYVGYWGGLGVQGVTLEGRRDWTNRRLDHVLQITAGPINSENQQPALCTSTRGTLMNLASNGKTNGEIDIAGSSLMYAAMDRPADDEDQTFCGISVGQIGQYTALGFDKNGRELWKYPLPPGEYIHQVSRIQNVELPGTDTHWQIVAADGSVHWLNKAGQLIDQLIVGDTLTGITISQNDETTLIWVATNQQLTAWAVRPNPEQ